MEYNQECVHEFASKFFRRHGFPADEHMGVEVGTYLECSGCKARWLTGEEAGATRDVHAVLNLPLSSNAGTSVQALLDSYLKKEDLDVPRDRGARRVLAHRRSAARRRS